METTQSETLSFLSPDSSVLCRTLNRIDHQDFHRTAATLLLLFGAIAVLLAGIGTLGVTSSAVAERSKELGIRLALGASPASLQRTVPRSAFRLAAIGAAIGVPLAIGTRYALRSTLFGVGPQNPTILLTAAALVVLVGVGASWLPAQRALRIDAAATLRQ